MGKIDDQERWEQYAAQFLGPLQQPMPLLQTEQSLSPKSDDKIEPSFEVKGYNSLRDSIAPVKYIDPSNYAGSPHVQTGVGFVVDTNFRVASFICNLMMPIVRFEPVPKWLNEERKAGDVKAGEARIDLRRRMGVADSARLSSVLTSAIKRLANDAFAHLASWLLSDRLALLPGQIKLLAGKLKIVSKSWMAQTLDSLSEGLSTALSWTTSASRWCQNQFLRAKAWFA